MGEKPLPPTLLFLAKETLQSDAHMREEKSAKHA
jgi:hypothetical protein